jgi:hypothetical protein
VAVEIVKYINYDSRATINMKVVDGNSVLMEQELQLNDLNLTSDEINNFIAELKNKVDEEISVLNSNLSDEELIGKLSLILTVIALKNMLSR